MAQRYDIVLRTVYDRIGGRPAPVDMPSLLLQDIVLMTPSRKVRQRLDLSILEAELEMTIEGASTLTMKVHDETRGLLRSQLVREASRVEIDNLSYTLVQVSRDEDTLTLIFEDTAVYLLRQYDEPLKQRRYDADGVTRARFIQMMVEEVRKGRKATRDRPAVPSAIIPFRCPEVQERQRVLEPQRNGGSAGGATATVQLWADARNREGRRRRTSRGRG